MAAESFELKVFTPVGLALEATVTSVTLQGSDGQLGILPGHANYLGLLGTGPLEYTVAGTSGSKRIGIEGGFCTFASNTLSVLADSADVTSEKSEELTQ